MIVAWFYRGWFWWFECGGVAGFRCLFSVVALLLSAVVYGF